MNNRVRVHRVAETTGRWPRVGVTRWKVKVMRMLKEPSTTWQSPRSRSGTRERDLNVDDHEPRYGVGTGDTDYTYKVLGNFEGVFRERNGTPRQGRLVPSSRGKIVLSEEAMGRNAEVALEGLREFGVCWLLFHFHVNRPSRLGSNPVLKVSPPRLGGKRVGVFACRSPQRPNAIGLTAAVVERVDGRELHLSGIDLVDGTPILDIKPYVPTYDSWPDAAVPSWAATAAVLNSASTFQVKFSELAMASIESAVPHLRFYKCAEEVRAAITQVLLTDPRSIARKKRHQRSLSPEVYPFAIDCLNVLAEFDDSAQEVLVMDAEVREPLTRSALLRWLTLQYPYSHPPLLPLRTSEGGSSVIDSPGATVHAIVRRFDAPREDIERCLGSLVSAGQVHSCGSEFRGVVGQ